MQKWTAIWGHFFEKRFSKDKHVSFFVLYYKD